MILSIKKEYLLALFLIIAACFLAYFNSLGNPFIWDDQALVVKNTLIRSPQNLPLSFTSDLYFGVTSGSNFYRPLQTISYIYDFHFWQLNPFGYHLTNIFLQALVSFLAFLLLLNLSVAFLVSLSAALFFAVSPLNTESVTYISGRAEMLMGIFVILSLICFIRSQKKEAKHPQVLYLISIFSFTTSLLAKEVAIVFPFIILGCIFFILHEKLREKNYLIKNFVPYLLLTVIYLFLRSSYFNFETLRQPSLTNVAWFVRISVIPKIMFTYCKLLILPTGLHMSRELVRPVSISGILISFFSLGTIILVCFACLKYRPKHRVGSFMLFWSLVFFIPQSGIFPINAFVAEHFIYLSSLSFYLCLAYILHKFLRKPLFILAAGLFCLFYILLTAGRNFEWKNPLVFYKNIIKYSPDSFQGHNNLGLQYEYLGRFDEAKIHYQKALEIMPDLIEARSNLASLYFKLKKYEQAKLNYEILENSDLGSKAGEIKNNIANIYEAKGDTERAIVKYNQALKLDPGLKFAHFNLARIYFSKKNNDLAVFHILESLGEKSQKERDSAGRVIAVFLKDKAGVNNASEFYNNLGIDLAKSQLWQVSIEAFNCAIELSPDSADYYFNLGLAYLKMGQKAKARYALKQALRINPNHIRAKSLMIKPKI